MHTRTDEVVLDNRDNKPGFRGEHPSRGVDVADSVSPLGEEHRGDVVGWGRGSLHPDEI